MEGFFNEMGGQGLASGAVREGERGAHSSIYSPQSSPREQSLAPKEVEKRASAQGR